MRATNYAISVSLNGKPLFRTDWFNSAEDFEAACVEVIKHFPRGEGFTVTRVDAEILHHLKDVTQ